MQFAFRFKTRLGLEEIRDRLQGKPWNWLDRDNDRWGPYLSACPFDEGYERAIVKILLDDGFALNVHCRDDADEAELRITVLDVLLPAIGATEIEPTEPYD